MFARLQVLRFLDAPQRPFIPQQQGMRTFVVALHGDGTLSCNTWAAKILHNDYHGCLNIDTVFLNPKLIKVSIVLLQTLLMIHD